MMAVENETWEDKHNFNLFLAKLLHVGFSPTFSFIFVPYPRAVHVQLMAGVNDVMSENMENNTWMSRSVSVALHMDAHV